MKLRGSGGHTSFAVQDSTKDIRPHKCIVITIEGPFCVEITLCSSSSFFLLQKLAVDVGCGTGQSTRILSPFFRRVLGLDVSQAQIENARKESVDNVEFQ